MLKASDFRPIQLDNRDKFIRQYERFQQVHSDNTFTNMICWNHYAHYQFADVEDNIILSSSIEGNRRYRPPIGPRNPGLLLDVMTLAAKSGDEQPLFVLDPDTKNWISLLYPKLKFCPERKYFDYVYRASDLAELPGKKYLTIRHQLNQFRKTCSPMVEAIGKDNIEEVRLFLEQWCDWKNCDSEPVLANEKMAIFFALSHFDELKLSGLAIRAESKIGAISIFEGLNRDTALVHFEKGLPECKGIYRAINAETAKLLVKDFTYINRESDMGVEGMREAKMRYHPDHMAEVHYIKRDELEKII